MNAREKAIAIVVELRQTSRFHIDLNLGITLRRWHEERAAS